MAIRTHVSLRPRDLPRLGSHVTTASGVANTTWPLLGYYYEVYVLGAGDIQIRRANTGRPPWDMTAAVTSSGTDSEPVVAVKPDGRVLVAFTRGGTDVYLAESPGDDGFTFTMPTSLFTGGTHPMIAVDYSTGDVVYGSYVAGNLQTRFQANGDAAPGAAVTVKDSLGANLAVEDDCAGIAYIPDGARRLNMIVRIAGGSGPSTWHSEDEAATFTDY